jgi:hypothetical protein
MLWSRPLKLLNKKSNPYPMWLVLTDSLMLMNSRMNIWVKNSKANIDSSAIKEKEVSFIFL